MDGSFVSGMYEGIRNAIILIVAACLVVGGAIGFLMSRWFCG